MFLASLPPPPQPPPPSYSADAHLMSLLGPDEKHMSDQTKTPPVGPAVSQTCHQGSARQPVCGLDGQSVITSDPAKVTNPRLS